MKIKQNVGNRIRTYVKAVLLPVTFSLSRMRGHAIWWRVMVLEVGAGGRDLHAKAGQNRSFCSISQTPDVVAGLN